MTLSRIWGAEAISGVAPVAVAGFRPAEGGFRSLYTAPAGHYQPSSAGHAPVTDAMSDEDPLEQARIDAFTLGFDEGCRVTQEANGADAEARAQLAQALEHLAPAPSGTLATMLSAAVIRLVGQIVGDVEIDTATLMERCLSVAAFIDQSEGRNALHLHPEDLPLVEAAELDVALVADANMKRGCVRLDTAQGWVEDGPDVRLSRLRALLDDMEGRS